MPPAIAAAGIGAAGSLLGGVLQSRSANKATDAQMEANRQALQYQKQQEAMRRQDWMRAMQAYQAGRQALLQRYGLGGLNIPSVTPEGGGGLPGGAVPRGAGMTLADLAQMKFPQG